MSAASGEDRRIVDARIEGINDSTLDMLNLAVRGGEIGVEPADSNRVELTYGTLKELVRAINALARYHDELRDEVHGYDRMND